MHNPGNPSCPRNADSRNESCSCGPPFNHPRLSASEIVDRVSRIRSGDPSPAFSYVLDAMAVILLTPEIRAFLEEHDPVALIQAQNAVNAAARLAPPVFVKHAIERYLYYGDRARDFQGLSREQIEQFEDFLVASGHPLAAEPQTQESRFKSYIKEQADKQDFPNETSG